MSTIIKICGLSTSATLEAAIEAGADMVGFVFFEKSPRHLFLDQARALSRCVEGRAKITVLTVDAADETLRAIIDATRPDFLQLHGRETPTRVAELKKQFGLSTIKAIGVGRPDDIAAADAYVDSADRLLFDAKAPRDACHPGGNGIVFDWRLLAALDQAKPWLLSGGLDPDNVAEAIAVTGARGVDVSSGVEIAPGMKDVGKIRAFVAAARSAFAQAEASRKVERPQAMPWRVA